MTDDSFADAPVSLAEVRSHKTRSGSDWTPRDLLIKMLRDHDSGEVVLSALVVSWDGPTTSGYYSACPNGVTAMGLFAMGMTAYGINVQESKA